MVAKKLVELLKRVYLELFRSNDTPHKIAKGLGIGVFTGIIPGIGPVAALFLAMLLRANRAGALLGSLFTNTWLSFLTFLLSIKIGSAILKISWIEAHNNLNLLLKDFHWRNLIQLSALKLILPLLIGYLVVASGLAMLIYLITLLVATRIKRNS